ncbi:IS6 family transposase [Martelella soudanensis]|uniref:IS6 family transposase n=1 Tax=unclassified Martelella TaxID=2629616 RepID=UPI0015E02B92|nr:MULTISPECIES: IS6 family transposase [unclassified Martelella]
MQTPDISFKRHRFPPEIVAHAVWLYLRFNLSLREVEEILLERGIDVSYETVRRWIANFGPQIASNLRRPQARPGDVWYLDEVVVKCAGTKFWLWRVVDQHGTVLEEVLQKRRDKRAENNHLPFRKRERTMQGHRSPGALQRFVAMHSATRNCFSVPSRRRAAQTIRYHRLEAFDAWKTAACIA